MSDDLVRKRPPQVVHVNIPPPRQRDQVELFLSGALDAMRQTRKEGSAEDAERIALFERAVNGDPEAKRQAMAHMREAAEHIRRRGG